MRESSGTKIFDDNLKREKGKRQKTNKREYTQEKTNLAEEEAMKRKKRHLREGRTLSGLKKLLLRRRPRDTINDGR